MASHKAAGVKSLLLRAWRERWSDMQWSVCIKRHISTDSNEDAQQLAGISFINSDMGMCAPCLSYLKIMVTLDIIKDK